MNPACRKELGKDDLENSRISNVLHPHHYPINNPLSPAYKPPYPGYEPRYKQPIPAQPWLRQRLPLDDLEEELREKAFFKKIHGIYTGMNKGDCARTYVCYKCKQKGHWASDCPSPSSAEILMWHSLDKNKSNSSPANPSERGETISEWLPKVRLAARLNMDSNILELLLEL